MRKIVFDIETQNTFNDVKSRDAAALDISLLVIYDYQTGKYEAFMEKDFPKLWPILEEADMLIGYNSDFFDIPLLNKYYPGDLTRIKSLDILKEIKKSLGKRLSLDMVAAGTLGAGKISKGLQAVEWWKEGKIDKIREYCLADVKITKEIYDYALKHGELKYKLVNEIKAFPIETKGWEEKEESAINYTLPF